MAWNEPGGGGKDPWGNRNGNQGDGPPDLDEALKKLQEKLGGLFGGGSGNKGSGNGGGISVGPLLLALLVIGSLLYAIAGFYQVDEKQRAVVLRFGAFSGVKQPGLSWNAPLVTEVFIENVTEERQYPSRGLMLTEDESIVELPITVQYNVGNVKDYVLNVRSPEVSLRHAADSALRHVVGSTELEQVLSAGRGKIADEVESRLQQYLDSYGTGIVVRDVNIQEGRPPQEVRAAFDDVIKAKEDEERLKNEAQAYANGVVPGARGRAQRMLEEAEAYRAEVTSRAEGETERFLDLLAAYQQAPKVTRERLYIESLEQVMSDASKVLVDVEGGNNMMYLPLDKLMQAGGRDSADGTPRAKITQDQLRQISDHVSRQLGRDNNTRQRGR